jgi:replication-associated recombination protein RarA
VGKARRIAKLAFKRVAFTEDADPVRLLFWGPPGCGKSRLATVLADVLSEEQPCNIIRINGQSMTIEVVRAWQQEGQYRSILGGRMVKIVEEIDAASNAAMNELRTWLDNIANGTAFIATTNKKLDDVQEQLSSRCFAYDFTAGAMIEATIQETTHLLMRFGLSGDDARGISSNCMGNVRASLIDAEVLLDHMDLMAEERNRP